MNYLRHSWESVIAFLSRRSRRFYVMASILWVMVIGSIDLATTPRIGLVPFYIPAVFLFTWATSLRVGFFMCLVTTVLVVLGRWLDPPTALLRPGFAWEGALDIFINFVLFAMVTAALRTQSTHAGYDALTGLPNRRALERYLRREVARCHRERRPLTVGFIDCDNFKSINDSAGHHTGDRVLRLVAQTVNRSIRTTDLGARVGGDEFAVVMPGIAGDDARAAFATLRENLSRAAAGERLAATFSIGVAAFGTPPSSPEAILQRADDIMFSVKRNGKDSLLFSDVGAGR